MARNAPEVPAESDAPREPQSGERKCGVCEVKLSSYNPGPNCWQHTIGYPWRGPSAKPRYD